MDRRPESSGRASPVTHTCDALHEGLVVNVRLRPITADDLESVRLLRNANRHAFFDDREISIDDQRRWFERLPERPVRFLVIELEHRVIGTISVANTGAGKEIGNLVLDPQYRGRGIMGWAVAQLTAEPGLYLAEIKVDNAASQKVFAAAGFAPDFIRVRKHVE